MERWIILGIYVVGVLLSTIILPRVFPREKYWEGKIVDGKACPVDKKTYKIRIYEMSAIWPLIVALMPLKLFTMFTDWCCDKFNKK